MMLPLNSSQWEVLQHFGSQANIPQLISAVRSQVDANGGKQLALLESCIYHQFSCCEATYAVVPHLVDIGVALNPRESVDLWILIGSIASTHNLAEDAPMLPRPILDQFSNAIGRAEPCCIKSLLSDRWDSELCYQLGVSAIGLSGHALGKLVMDNLHPDAGATSSVLCPMCTEEIQIAFFDSGLVVEKGDTPLNPPSPRPPSPPKMRVATRRLNNPWEVVRVGLMTDLQETKLAALSRPHVEAAMSTADAGVSATTEPSAVFCLLGCLVAISGDIALSQMLFHACDEIVCPECKTAFVFAEHWWGLKR